MYVATVNGGHGSSHGPADPNTAILPSSSRPTNTNLASQPRANAAALSRDTSTPYGSSNSRQAIPAPYPNPDLVPLPPGDHFTKNDSTDARHHAPRHRTNRDA